MNRFEIIDSKQPGLGAQLRQTDKQSHSRPSLPLPKNDTYAVYICTIGSDCWQNQLLDWLNAQKHRWIYIIPQDLEMLHDVLMELLSHTRVSVGGDYTEYIWEHLFYPWELLGGCSSYIGDAVFHAQMDISLYKDYGVTVIKNVLKNLTIPEPPLKGDMLYGVCTGIPAIVCGAGASLADSLPALRHLGDKALIIGGGSSLEPLSEAGVDLHCAVTLDPKPPIERFYRQTYFDVPLFYQNQVSHTLLDLHHGPKICMGPPGNFLLEEHLLSLTELPRCDVGWTVSTFAIMIAVLLGCSPVYFVGLDLSIDERGKYCSGISGEDTYTNRIPIKDKNNKDVYTRPDFLMSKYWIEKFILEHPNITFINATTKGLLIQGATNAPLQGLEQSFDIKGLLHHRLLECPNLSCLFIKKNIKLLKQSLLRTQSITTHMLSALSKQKSIDLYRTQLDKEVFFTHHLFPIWSIWKPLMQTPRVVAAMTYVDIEKCVQECIFYQTVSNQCLNSWGL